MISVNFVVSLFIYEWFTVSGLNIKAAFFPELFLCLVSVLAVLVARGTTSSCMLYVRLEIPK